MSDPGSRLKTRTYNREVGSLQVNYADVLAQAVDNEKWRVLRQVMEILNKEPVKTHNRYGYDAKDISADTYKKNVVRAVDAL